MPQEYSPRSKKIWTAQPAATVLARSHADQHTNHVHRQQPCRCLSICPHQLLLCRLLLRQFPFQLQSQEVDQVGHPTSRSWAELGCPMDSNMGRPAHQERHAKGLVVATQAEGLVVVAQGMVVDLETMVQANHHLQYHWQYHCEEDCSESGGPDWGIPEVVMHHAHLGYGCGLCDAGCAICFGVSSVICFYSVCATCCGIGFGHDSRLLRAPTQKTWRGSGDHPTQSSRNDSCQPQDHSGRRRTALDPLPSHSIELDPDQNAA
mmetsp:Transcript_81545/g.149440  ORF Transcript_81545/g.149440 Transcript_81545/m.149440 type:complete len:263 (+) Transcript_81545:575-1363(+)